MAALVLGSSPSGAEEVLKAVTAFPKPLDFTQSFLRYVETVNAAGKGVVRIQVMGGPEVIPPPEQGDAVRRGVVDMQYGPGTYYLGTVPEVDAMVGSNRTAVETRGNGGRDALDEAFEERLGAHLLGHFDTGIPFHIWTTKEPPRTADGGLDLSGFKIRSQPIYREFFESLGITNVSIPVPEVYTALERGVVDGMGFPMVGIADLGWTKHLKYRIDPPFFQTDLVVIVNEARWESLSPEAKKILEETAVAYEKESYDYFQARQKELDAKLRGEGMTVVTLDGDAAKKFLDGAYSTAWSRLAAKSPEAADKLKPLFYEE
jgi:TRAP-type C4-dicarboxylate transport system substrate-binding protein